MIARYFSCVSCKDLDNVFCFEEAPSFLSKSDKAIFCVKFSQVLYILQCHALLHCPHNVVLAERGFCIIHFNCAYIASTLLCVTTIHYMYTFIDDRELLIGDDSC